MAGKPSAGQPSRRAEVVLLALYAIDPNTPLHVRELSRSLDLLEMETEELVDVLNELHAQGFILEDPEDHTIQLTPLANAHFLALAEEGLTDNILRHRSLQEQAEALLIWRLAMP